MEMEMEMEVAAFLHKELFMLIRRCYNSISWIKCQCLREQTELSETAKAAVTGARTCSQEQSHCNQHSCTEKAV